MSNWHGGKGSKRRNSDEDLYTTNWERIFGKKEHKSELDFAREKSKTFSSDQD